MNEFMYSSQYFNSYVSLNLATGTETLVKEVSEDENNVNSLRAMLLLRADRSDIRNVRMRTHAKALRLGGGMVLCICSMAWSGHSELARTSMTFSYIVSLFNACDGMKNMHT